MQVLFDHCSIHQRLGLGDILSSTPAALALKHLGFQVGFHCSPPILAGRLFDRFIFPSSSAGTVVNSFNNTWNGRLCDNQREIVEQTLGLTLTPDFSPCIWAEPEEIDYSLVVVHFTSYTTTDGILSSRCLPRNSAAVVIESLQNAGYYVVLATNKTTKPGLGEDEAVEPDIPGLIDLCAGAAAVVSTDSAPLHFANIFRTPALSLTPWAGSENMSDPDPALFRTIPTQCKLSPCIRKAGLDGCLNPGSIPGNYVCHRLLGPSDLIKDLIYQSKSREQERRERWSKAKCFV